MDTLVTSLAPDGAQWVIGVAGDEPLRADAVIVATGGLSVPNTGSDGAGLSMLRALGHTMHPTYAALTPVTAAPNAFSALSGISLRVSLTATSAARQATAGGGFLFTHQGYSGPSVLNVSHVAVRARADGGNAAGATLASAEPATIYVQWTTHDEAAWNALLQNGGTRQVSSVVRHEMPDRLADVLLAQAEVDPTRKLAELTRDERRRLVDVLVRGALPWNGDEGYKKAEVTGGGVALSEVDPRTMESRKASGLFLCGEVLDAFGPIGGYNFLWAWVTGRAAGTAAGVSVASASAGVSV